MAGGRSQELAALSQGLDNLGRSARSKGGTGRALQHSPASAPSASAAVANTQGLFCTKDLSDVWPERCVSEPTVLKQLKCNQFNWNQLGGVGFRFPKAALFSWWWANHCGTHGLRTMWDVRKANKNTSIAMSLYLRWKEKVVIYEWNKLKNSLLNNLIP